MEVSFKFWVNHPAKHLKLFWTQTTLVTTLLIKAEQYIAYCVICQKVGITLTNTTALIMEEIYTCLSLCPLSILTTILIQTATLDIQVEPMQLHMPLFKTLRFTYRTLAALTRWNLKWEDLISSSLLKLNCLSIWVIPLSLRQMLSQLEVASRLIPAPA